MDLEASIVERLQKLRLWQIEQQECLLQQQLAQREILSHEQDKMYKALGLSIQDFNRNETIIGGQLHVSQETCLNPVVDGIQISEHGASPTNDEELGKTRFQVSDSLDRSDSLRSNQVFPHSAERIDFDEDSNIEVRSSNRLIMPCIQLTTANNKYSPHKQTNEGHIHANQHSTNSHSSLVNEEAQIQKFLMDGVAPLSMGTPQKRYAVIDDVPVPSPKKDFQTLLEERLKNDVTESNTEIKDEPKCKVKRPFLKKGQGLARFKMSQGSKKTTQRTRQRSASLSSNMFSSKQSKTPVGNAKQKGMLAHSANVHSKSTSTASVKEQQLSLRNIPPPQKKVRTKSEPTLSTKQLNNIDNEIKQVAELTGSDSDSRTHKELEEVRIFELLEEKAENSSFCSTSSTVVAFLQQSTPFRVRKNVINSEDGSVYVGQQNNASRVKHGNVVKDKKQSSQENIPTRPNLKQDQLKQTIIRKSLKKALDPYWVTTDVLNDEETATNDESCSVNAKSTHSIHTGNLQQLSKGTESNKLTSHNSYVSHVHEGQGFCNCPERDNDNDVDVSLHVRFSEYNEYKTIGLTDTSSISNESVLVKNYTDEGAWSDCSQSSESSNVESFIAKRRAIKSEEQMHKEETIKHQSTITQSNIEDIHSELQKQGLTQRIYRSADERFEISDVTDHSSDEEKCIVNEVCSEEEQFLDMGDNGVITLFEKGAARKTCVSTNTDAEWSVKEKQTANENSKDSDETIFKSELLKSRLIELEKEIDIFRKENSTLYIQRQKLQEDYVKLHKEFKKKESDFEDARRRVEERLNEEKKKLAREKTALESRIRDSQEKAQQNKLERQEAQNLKQQLMQLTEEMNNKESRWNAAQSRHKSQVRILRAENAKLKEELEKLHSSKKSNVRTRRPGYISNAKAIHQINKQLHDHAKGFNKSKKDSLSDDEDKLVEPMMEALYPKSDFKKLSHRDSKDTDVESNQDSVEEALQKPRKAYQSLESVARKRSLYEHLLKDATSSFATNQETLKRTDADLAYCTQSERENQTHKTRHEDIPFDPNHSVINTLNDNCNKDNPEGNHISKLTSILLEESSSALEKRSSPPNTSQTYASPSSQGDSINKQDVKRIQHLDGRIEYWYVNGNVKKVFPDQGISKMIYYNGDVRETDKDGKVRYFYASTRTWHTTMPDGLEILEFPDGQIERRSLSGTVEIWFPDGSVRTLKSDGTEKWALPDETIVETFPNGEKILTLPNGQREVHTAAHKRREYPDGTVKLVYPDGTQETRYSNGRTRLKDKEGNLLMDSY